MSILQVLLSAVTNAPDQSIYTSSSGAIIVAAIAALATICSSFLLVRGQKKQSTLEGFAAEREAMNAERLAMNSDWKELREAVDASLEACRTENEQLQNIVSKLYAKIATQDIKIAQQDQIIKDLRETVAKFKPEEK